MAGRFTTRRGASSDLMTVEDAPSSVPEGAMWKVFPESPQEPALTMAATPVQAQAAATTSANPLLSDKLLDAKVRLHKRLIEEINPILRGWVNYFAVGHSSRCFSYIRDWVEKKIRCHLARARQRQGFGWKRWSREWLYGTLGLFHEYRVVYQPPSWAAAPTRLAP